MERKGSSLPGERLKQRRNIKITQQQSAEQVEEAVLREQASCTRTTDRKDLFLSKIPSASNKMSMCSIIPEESTKLVEHKMTFEGLGLQSRPLSDTDEEFDLPDDALYELSSSKNAQSRSVNETVEKPIEKKNINFLPTLGSSTASSTISRYDEKNEFENPSSFSEELSVGSGEKAASAVSSPAELQQDCSELKEDNSLTENARKKQSRTTREEEPVFALTQTKTVVEKEKLRDDMIDETETTATARSETTIQREEKPVATSRESLVKTFMKQFRKDNKSQILTNPKQKISAHSRETVQEKVATKENNIQQNNVTFKPSRIPKDQTRCRPQALLSVGKRLNDSLEALGDIIEAERTTKAKSIETWASIRSELSTALRLLQTSLSTTSQMSENNEPQNTASSEVKLLECLHAVHHRTRRSKSETEKAYFQQSHMQDQFLRRLEDIKDDAANIIKTQDNLEPPDIEQFTYSPLAKGMEQAQFSEITNCEHQQGLACPEQFPPAELVDFKAVQSNQESILRMKTEESETKLNTICQLLKDEESKHRLYTVRNAKMLYVYQSRTDEIKRLVKNANILLQDITKSKVSAEKHLKEQSRVLLQQKDQLMLEARLELELVKSLSKRAVEDYEKAKKACLLSKDKALSEVEDKKSAMENELQKKQEVLSGYYRKQEANLISAVSEIREEISTWREFKEAVCQQFYWTKDLYQKSKQQKKQQEDTQRWLLAKQKEVRETMKQNERTEKKLKQEAETNRKVIETCKILKKQIELTILYHKEKGSVHQIVYWDSKRVKAFIPPKFEFPLHSTSDQDHTDVDTSIVQHDGSTQQNSFAKECLHS